LFIILWWLIENWKQEYPNKITQHKEPSNLESNNRDEILINEYDNNITIKNKNITYRKNLKN